MYGMTKSSLDKNRKALLEDSKSYYPSFVKRHLSMVTPFEGKEEMVEFENEEDSTNRGKDEISYLETKKLNSNYKEQNTTKNSHENAPYFNNLDAALKDVEFFSESTNVERGKVKRSNGPKISDSKFDSSQDHIIGGKLEYENWPWMVSIYNLPDMFHICSGALIDERHILTAAHCYVDLQYGSFVASVGNLMKITDPSQGYKVEEVIVHKNFTKPCYCNDIALLRLEEPVDSHITPICLPVFDTAVVGENTTLLGWGDTEFMGGAGMSSTGRLQKLNNLPITPSEDCRMVFSRILHKNLPRTFADSYICAGVPDGSKDACVGDSGGPLLHRSYDGLWTILGVVSFGYKCGTPGVPGIYTRVSYYLEWIFHAMDVYYTELLNL